MLAAGSAGSADVWTFGFSNRQDVRRFGWWTDELRPEGFRLRLGNIILLYERMKSGMVGIRVKDARVFHPKDV